MSSLNYMELCRLCLVKDRVQIPIFEGEGDIRQIFLKIAACLPVKVEKDDKLPKKICDDCMFKVEMLYQFWNTTANAEKQLLEWLGEAAEDNKKTTSEPHVKQENLEQDPCSELAKSLSRVEAVLAEAREAESDNDHFAGDKPETDSEDEPLSNLEPTTFVNVGLDGSGTTESRIQGEFLAPGAPSTSKTISAPSAQTATSGCTSPPLLDDTNDSPAGFGKDNEEEIVKQVFARSVVESVREIKETLKHESPRKEKVKRERVMCDICQKKFVGAGSLKKHKSTVHAASFVCGVCEKPYPSSKQLKAHVSKVHPPNGAYLKCHLCEYQTHNRFCFKGHIDRHYNAASHICDECGKGFYSRGNLHEHKQGKHGSGFQCEICGASLSNMSNLREHRKTHEPKSVGVKYQCDVCGKGFRAKSKCAFRLHVLKHKGIVKQYKCTDCNKIVSSSYSFRQHMRIHSGEKPFICEYCSKAFSEKKYLLAHTRIHTGEKPYACDICGVRFNQRSTMTSHRKSHGKN